MDQFCEEFLANLATHGIGAGVSSPRNVRERKVEIIQITHVLQVVEAHFLGPIELLDAIFDLQVGYFDRLVVLFVRDGLGIGDENPIRVDVGPNMLLDFVFFQECLYCALLVYSSENDNFTIVDFPDELGSD